MEAITLDTNTPKANSKPPNSLPRRPDSLRPWRLLDGFIEGSTHARVIVGCWAGAVQTRQQPGFDAEGNPFTVPTTKNHRPSDRPLAGAVVHGPELHEVWDRWANAADPTAEDIETLGRSLYPVVHKLTFKCLAENEWQRWNDLTQDALMRVLERKSSPPRAAIGMRRFLETIVANVHAEALRCVYDGPAPTGEAKKKLAALTQRIDQADDADDVLQARQEREQLVQQSGCGRRIQELSFPRDRTLDAGEDAAPQHGLRAKIQMMWDADDLDDNRPTGHLSPRLREVAQLLQLGLSKAEIAAKLKITVRSVERIATGRKQPQTATIPILKAGAFRLRVILFPTRAQREVLLHTVQAAMTA